MASSHSAEWYRQTNPDASTSGAVAAAATTTTAIAATSAKHTVYVQSVTIVITTSAAQIITIKDTAGTPVEIGSITASAALGSVYTLPFGARGFALTEGKDLVFTQSAGPAYSYTVEGYQRLTTATSDTTVARTI